MADRVEAFSPTITAGIPSTSPVTLPLSFKDGIVRQVDIRVPPGPLGLMGFVIAYAGTSIIPDGQGKWLIMNDEKWSYPIDNNPTGGQWQLIGYNTDIHDHTVHLRMLVDELPLVTPQSVQVLAIAPGTAAVP